MGRLRDARIGISLLIVVGVLGGWLLGADKAELAGLAIYGSLFLLIELIFHHRD
jgi:hypothetical protein